MSERRPSWDACDGCPSILFDHHENATCGREAVPMGPGCLMPRLAYEQPGLADRLAVLDSELRGHHD